MIDTYRCKHVVQGMKWLGNAGSREILNAWHQKQTGEAPQYGDDDSVKIKMGDEYHRIEVGEWILWSGDNAGIGEFLAMSDEDFNAEYTDEDFHAEFEKEHA